MKTAADNAERLRPGRHGLAPELVVENQRGRILAAVCECHLELGYAGMSVTDISSRAGVSTATFYKLFENKSQSVVAAQQDASEALRAEIVQAWSRAGEWPEQVNDAIGAALLFAARSPGQTLLLVSDRFVGDLELSRTPIDLHYFLVDLLGPGRERAVDPAGIPRLTEGALIGALRSLIAGRLVSGREAELPGLQAELTQLVLMPYLGREGVARFADRPAG